MIQDDIAYQINPFGRNNFEGASIDYKNGIRGLQTGEADQLIARELKFLRMRSRYAVNNNGYARQALNTSLTKQGAIETQWKIQGKLSSKSKASSDGLVTHNWMTDVWEEFTENPNFDGLGDYNVTQALSNSSFFLDGCSFQQLMIVRTNNTNTVPLKIKQIPAQLHSMLMGHLDTNDLETIINHGIKFNSDGVPISYFFHKSFVEQQAINIQGTIDFNLYREIPATELVHYFHRDYAGQWLGVPTLAPVLLSLYELDDFIGATIQKQKAAQAIALVISQTNAALATTAKVGLGDVEGVVDLETGKTKQTFKTTGSNTLELNPGEQAQLLQSGDIGNNWETLVRTELRKVAAVSNVLYHELTGDTSELSFSAINALLLHSRTRLEYLALFETIPLREKKIANYFKKLAILYDTEKTAKKQAINSVPVFKLPKYRSLDPLKDTQAAILALQNNIGLWQDSLTEAGISIEEWISDKDLQKLHEVDFNPSNNTTSMQQANNTRPNSNSVGN